MALSFAAHAYLSGPKDETQDPPRATNSFTVDKVTDLTETTKCPVPRPAPVMAHRFETGPAPVGPRAYATEDGVALADDQPSQSQSTDDDQAPPRPSCMNGFYCPYSSHIMPPQRPQAPRRQLVQRPMVQRQQRPLLPAPNFKDVQVTHLVAQDSSGQNRVEIIQGGCDGSTKVTVISGKDSIKQSSFKSTDKLQKCFMQKSKDASLALVLRVNSDNQLIDDLKCGANNSASTEKARVEDLKLEEKGISFR